MTQPDRLLNEEAYTRPQLASRIRQLAALNSAALAIAAELTLENVLKQIVDSARELVGAQYAALGVPNADGRLDTFIHSGMPTELAKRIPHLPQGHGLLGALIHDPQPIRIPRIADDPRSVGFPPNHPPMESFLGVPVLAANDVLGNLYLTNKLEADEFSAYDLELVEMLAAHVAIAIQNARLYEQVGRLAIVDERARIGMDLHDGIIQSIYAVGLILESTRLEIQKSHMAEADILLENAIIGLNDTIRDIRNFILDLRPHRFSGNLEQGLSRLVREFQANTMIPVTLSVPPDVVAILSTPVVRAIFLTTQEALANIARHARANQVSIIARRGARGVELVITDNGRGFDVSAMKQAVGHGLANMRARAEELKGTFRIQTAPGKGTTICLTFPIQ
ncbi:MAG: GAF domain-containing sensor histidine kinase [Chloroflexi bacterium]|nr:GAF domain-containing sensor histidine kinase [Chloroflexota bacterium]